MKRQYTQVKCKECGKEWKKESFDLKKWQGRCKSCAKKGNTIATGNKGKPKSILHKEKISKAHIGRPHPWSQGDKSHSWKGGVTPLYQKIRQSLEYKIWRRAVYERDNYACIWCGDNKGGNLEADHIKPFAFFPELRFAIDNGRTLCHSCHKSTDTYGKKSYKFKPK